MAFPSLLFVMIISVANSDWTIMYDPPMPRYSARMAAAGSYNGSIFILGGGDYNYQFLEYNNDIWIDHGYYALGSRTYGYGDYYTQINHLLYMISPIGNTLNVYNMDTNIFVSDWVNFTNHNTGATACLTSTHNTLFIIGGGYYGSESDKVSVLFLDTMEWFKNVPSLQKPRYSHSCNIDPDTSSLYAIGGYHVGNSVEMINIENIIQGTWHILEDTLSFSQWGTGLRSIWINNKIYVFGDGYNVNIINPKTQTITVAQENLPIYGRCAVTEMDNITHLFNNQYWLINDLTQLKIAPMTTTDTSSTTYTPSTTYTSSNTYTSSDKIEIKNANVYVSNKSFALHRIVRLIWIFGIITVCVMAVLCGFLVLKRVRKRYFKNKNEMEKIPELAMADDASIKGKRKQTNPESEGKHGVHIEEMINNNGEIHQLQNEGRE